METFSMSAIIEVNGIRATINGYQWTSSNKDLEQTLNLMLDPYGPSGADPNPDATAAQAAIDKLGGKLIRFDKDTSRPGTVH